MKTPQTNQTNGTPRDKGTNRIDQMTQQILRRGITMKQGNIEGNSANNSTRYESTQVRNEMTISQNETARRPIKRSVPIKHGVARFYTKRIAFVFLITLGLFGGLLAQQHTENNSDQTLRGRGRVNPSTLGMEMSIPLGAYPGKGINLPVSISYSSKAWRMDHQESAPKASAGCNAIYHPKFGENSAAGWTSSLGVAYVEYTGKDNLFKYNGFPNTVDDLCGGDTPPGYNYNGFVKRIQIHLPSGESHELRASDTPITYLASSPPPADMLDGTYYSVDGSKMKYIESTKTLYMPDGSRYNFGGFTNMDGKTIRKATKYIDINDNQLTFFAPTATYPNGYWRDTLNRLIPVPMPLENPTAAGITNYAMPSFAGGTMNYQFHWKQLKGATASDSALTDFSEEIRHLGDWNTADASVGGNATQRPSSEALFHSGWENWAVSYDSTPKFNPIVLAAVELPDGRKYEFSYNIYGEIEHVKYPTGGEEEFDFVTVASTSKLDINNKPGKEANRGVIQRRVKENSSATPYTWVYTMAGETVGTIPGLKVIINNPDGTKTERLLYRSDEPCSGCNYGSWGFNNILAGMAFEERSYASSGQLISKKKMAWATTSKPINASSAEAQWHPRVTQVESIIYDLSGNAISSTSKMFYAGDLEDITNHLDVNLTKQYGFTATLGALGPLQRQTQVIHLEYDSSIAQSTKDAYKAKHLISLPTKTFIYDATSSVTEPFVPINPIVNPKLDPDDIVSALRKVEGNTNTAETADSADSADSAETTDRASIFKKVAYREEPLKGKVKEKIKRKIKKKPAKKTRRLSKSRLATFGAPLLGTVVAKSEIKYDESGYSDPYQGNPTTART